ncbi:hypothetical protein [Seonamhaeicola marinus]|uniref:GLPGLI family protein n=1 Tax=Seonamhaeicola marinus TaxID=1912246 RepID=A0A5D0HV55_9FLAO|nr:hypothetical protein [Seonamhaeicola marinus]TYA74027.1 hypothetical protein FUA24_11820 [Seonamhaeicola marinus]
MRKIRNLNIILFILSFATAFAQSNMITPKNGIDGISIKIDTTNISVVEKLYGNEFDLNANQSFTRYTYPKIGLAFQYDTADKNKIIRSIFLESPFQAKLKNGIELNKTSMKEVWKTYSDKGCFTSKTYAWYSQKGISFFIKKDSTTKGYDSDKKIYKIEIHNKNDFGMPSRINFEFDKEQKEERIREMVNLLKEDDFTFKKFDDFWEIQKKNDTKPFPLKKQENFKRELEFDLTQLNNEIRIYGSVFELNVLKCNNDLVYLKLSSENEILVERYSDEQIDILLKKHQKKTNIPIDTKSAIDFPTDTYVYGTFCGFAGTPPNESQIMIDLVNERKYYKLARRLNSMNPEIATYGYIGLDFLRKKGIEIKPPELLKMAELSKSNIQLNTCQGCVYGVTETIQEVLTENNLKVIYKSYKDSGMLK